MKCIIYTYVYKHTIRENNLNLADVMNNNNNNADEYDIITINENI